MRAAALSRRRRLDKRLFGRDLRASVPPACSHQVAAEAILMDAPGACPLGGPWTPVRELGTNRLAAAIPGTRPVTQAPAGRLPMALPRARPGQLPPAHLNGFTAARSVCAGCATAQTTRALLTNWARAARCRAASPGQLNRPGRSLDAHRPVLVTETRPPRGWAS
jgi:hypothetical protein